MTAFWLVTWVEVRGRWRALASLALLLGLVGGIVLGAAAGARRTDTAYPRLRAWGNASQLSIVPEGTGLTGYYAALARLPQAAAVAPEALYDAGLPPAYRAAGRVVQAMASPDGSYGTTVDRVRLLAGQMFGPREPGAAVINQQLADIEHLSPGGTLRLAFIPHDPVTSNEELSKEFILSFKVTGIAVFDSQIVTTVALASAPTALLSPPFAATAAARSARAVRRLRPGCGPARTRPGSSPPRTNSPSSTPGPSRSKAPAARLTSSTPPTRSAPPSGPSSRRRWRWRSSPRWPR